MEQREEVFDRVYREYGPALYRFCLMQMKNTAKTLIIFFIFPIIIQSPKFIKFIISYFVY